MVSRSCGTILKRSARKANEEGNLLESGLCNEHSPLYAHLILILILIATAAHSLLFDFIPIPC